MQLALKLISSALQRQPKNQLLRVLKAVALQRTGKEEEGLQVWLVWLMKVPASAIHSPVQHTFSKYVKHLPCVTQVCEEVRHEVPADEQILSTMAIVYRRANRMQDLSAAFAAASSAHPRDEVLLKGVFTSYVRQACFCPQHQPHQNLQACSCPPAGSSSMLCILTCQHHIL